MLVAASTVVFVCKYMHAECALVALWLTSFFPQYSQLVDSSEALFTRNKVSLKWSSCCFVRSVVELGFFCQVFDVAAGLDRNAVGSESFPSADLMQR